MSLRLFSDSAVRLVADGGNAVSVEEFLLEQLQAIPLVFTLMWTPDIVIEIAKLQVRVLEGDGKGTWKEVLGQRWQDGDGEFSHPLGVFAQAQKIEVRVAAMAFEDTVPHVRGFVSAGGAAVKQIIPADPSSDLSMPRGELFLEKGGYTV